MMIESLFSSLWGLINENWTVSVVDDVATDAAQDGSTDLPHSTRSDDDQAAVVILRRLDDELAGMSKVGYKLEWHLHMYNKRLV